MILGNLQDLRHHFIPYNTFSNLSSFDSLYIQVPFCRLHSIYTVAIYYVPNLFSKFLYSEKNIICKNDFLSAHSTLFFSSRTNYSDIVPKCGFEGFGYLCPHLYIKSKLIVFSVFCLQCNCGLHMIFLSALEHKS